MPHLHKSEIAHQRKGERYNIIDQQRGEYNGRKVERYHIT